MKKILSYVLAFAMVLSLACSFSALPENRLEKAGKWGSNMPEADYHILKANAAPTIDGEFDGESVWGFFHQSANQAAQTGHPNRGDRFAGS